MPPRPSGTSRRSGAGWSCARSRTAWDGPWAVVAVEDAGVGFREEQAARLFEAFYTTKPDGLGMGLSISRSIIDGHRGRLWRRRTRVTAPRSQFALPPMH